MTSRTLLLLPGLLGDAASLWQQEAEFGRDHRVLVAEYPDTASISEQLDALARRLEGQRAVLIGQTLGGYLAQAFAREHPELVEALVLVHSGLPDPALGKRIRRDLLFVRLLPWPLLRWWLHRELRGMLAGLEASGDADPEQVRVVAGHFRQRFAGRLDRRRVLARYGLMANLHESPPLSGFAGPVMVLHSEGNVFARQLERLQAAFPHAVSHTMGRRHNLSLQVRPEESNRHIRGFLDSLPAA